MRLLSVALIFGLIVSSAHATDRTIRITGRAQVTVTTDQVKLGDIADVQSDRIEDDEAVIGLKKIWIQKSPQPAANETISANEILSTIAGQGVDLNAVAYTLPRVITVKRAGRVVTKAEIQNAIESYLHTTNNDMTIQNIDYADTLGVPPGQIQLAVDTLTSLTPGKRAAQIIASLDGIEVARGTIPLMVDEYRQIPVARRGVPKGSVVTDADVYMARFNTALVPTDAVEDASTLVGLEATHDIASGEVFRNTKLSMPKLIEAGAKVTMQFKSELFEATASGIALESGAVGQEIKIRNDSSKKIVNGIVTPEGLVRVK